MHGILNINKPAGKTSRDIVNIVQRLVRPAKTGHAGTLDPLATGVLVCPVGHGTKLIEYVQRLPKTYEAVFLLGHHSDTEDVEGNVVQLESPPEPTLVQIYEQLPQFVGTIAQVPPAYSALKVAGQRAYDLARQGKEVELASREIEVYELEVLHYDYPRLSMRMRCGSGTYVRSLGRDLARSLGTEAVMSELVRTAIGDFRIKEAVDPLSDFDRDKIEASLQPIGNAVKALPEVVVDSQQIVRLAQGKLLDLPGHLGGELAAKTAYGQLVAILQPGKEGGWRTVKNFANDYL